MIPPTPISIENYLILNAISNYDVNSYHTLFKDKREWIEKVTKSSLYDSEAHLSLII